jgi:hypothetical protein
MNHGCCSSGRLGSERGRGSNRERRYEQVSRMTVEVHPSIKLNL